jgi:hypothetical protein
MTIVLVAGLYGVVSGTISYLVTAEFFADLRTGG